MARVSNGSNINSNYVKAITQTSGTVGLATNTVYSMTITGNTTFTLPGAVSGIQNRIQLIAKVNGTYTLNFGTTQYFNKKAPKVESGNYTFYWDYDNISNIWAFGALSKGAAS